MYLKNIDSLLHIHTHTHTRHYNYKIIEKIII